MKAIETPPKNERLQSFSGDERWELLQRVLASSHFQKSARHREFLAYVTERILREPGVEIHEQEIASNVFQRPVGGIKGEDTIVRVQAYQLRKRLDNYFATLGALEPLIIEIPKGNYAPIFKERKPVELEAIIETAAPPAPKRDFRTPLIWLLAGLSAILATICLLLAFRSPPSTPLSQLWSQFARKDRRVDIVLADSSLSLLADIVRRPVSLSEYLRRDYWKDSDNLPEKEIREVTRMLMSRQHTSIGDANVASRISSLTNRQGANTTLFFARDFNIRNLKTDNIVILGSSRSNPWAELFESQLNFRFLYEERTRSATIENKAPLPGEAAQYRVQAGAGFCRIALLPNSDHTGDVLLIAGTEMEATEAGGEFLTSEQGISQLRRRLNLNGSERLPYFELLLKTTRVGGAAPSFEVLTHRLPRV